MKDILLRLWLELLLTYILITSFLMLWSSERHYMRMEEHKKLMQEIIQSLETR